jgi:uracil-DNA glycosylase family 4
VPLRPKPDACRGCPAYDVGLSFVKSRGPSAARIAFLGQGPGEQEAYNGIPFVGRSGQRLSRWCMKANLDLHTCHIDNVVKCWLPNNRPPTAAEVEFCRGAHWGVELRKHEHLQRVQGRSLVVVLVGVPAMKVFSPKANSKHAGRVMEVSL